MKRLLPLLLLPVLLGLVLAGPAFGEDKPDPLAAWKPEFDPAGGEKDVISKLKLGAVQGMLSSSVAAANVADRLGIVNLPYVIDTFDKLDRFRTTPELWQPFSEAALAQGIMVPDITGYGAYGWATTPVRNLNDAKAVNFRIAEAPVNADLPGLG